MVVSVFKVPQVILMVAIAENHKSVVFPCSMYLRKILFVNHGQKAVDIRACKASRV